jgi:S-formylglutathione hydrolase
MTVLASLNEHRCFGGAVSYHQHHSEACDAPMRFGIYAPPAAERGPVPAHYFLAGLTSTEENFLVKGGAQRYAAEHGLMLVAPDTSPRHLGLPGEGFYDPLTGVISLEAGFYGAGFYVDATAEPYSAHYKIHSYVYRELPAIVEANFPAPPGCRGDHAPSCNVSGPSRS